MWAGEAGGTDAGGGGLAWASTARADTPVEAGPERALVQGSVAVAASESGGAGAGVVVDAVATRTPVEAGVAGTLVDVDLAALPCKARTAAAHARSTMDHAQPTISAGQRRALVHSLLTVESSVAARTLAHVAAAVVLPPALAAVEAGRVGARQQAVLTVGALVTLATGAHVATLQVSALSSVPAGVAITLL